MTINAVLFDLGGVILTSPFEEFARYERETRLPERFIRQLNATNPDSNAWACLERGEISLAEFVERFEAEARSAGHELDGGRVLSLLAGEVRPEMSAAVRACAARLKTALLTNNFVSPGGVGRGADPLSGLLELFDVVVESSRAGVRKPEPRFYEIACEALGIEPSEAVFLDDLGTNLKPARQMGMVTIKVEDPGRALEELEAVVGFPLC